jgi:hypothetical protein
MQLTKPVSDLMVLSSLTVDEALPDSHFRLALY